MPKETFSRLGAGERYVSHRLLWNIPQTSLANKPEPTEFTVHLYAHPAHVLKKQEMNFPVCPKTCCGSQKSFQPKARDLSPMMHGQINLTLPSDPSLPHANLREKLKGLWVPKASERCPALHGRNH